MCLAAARSEEGLSTSEVTHDQPPLLTGPVGSLVGMGDIQADCLGRQHRHHMMLQGALYQGHPLLLDHPRSAAAEACMPSTPSATLR